MAGTCGTPGLFRNLRHSLRQTATRVLGTTISTLRACGAGGRGRGVGRGGKGGGGCVSREGRLEVGAKCELG